ncbi:sigma-70 family RNA polymerase sigma factor [Bariatricus sp. HCP28S3_D3]|uniref:sigma-70 family RNA polymerase sigma factor n=1 Tax=Bariatricus sp. HCP28S3_D3 TaxID=3438901 RepID=UPI003F8AADED
MENTTTISLLIEGMRYSIDQDTIIQLQNGTIPLSLQEEIIKRQGKDTCFDFCRQRRLIKRICDQIQEGKQPSDILSLIKSGSVSSEILFQIYHHKLIGKTEKLYSKNLISEDVLTTVKKHLITPEVLPQLDKAILIETAQYLYKKNEISRELLNGTVNGSVQPKFIRTIRRYYRQLQNSIEIEQKHTYCAYLNDDQYLPTAVYVSCPDSQIDKNLLAETTRKYLRKALAHLTADERSLIRRLYIDQIHLRPLAASIGVSEGTIRYRRDKILKKLRNILEKDMHVHSDFFFEQ